ncbi:MAG: outer-membrane lipoprotein carrier protein LolA [Spirochaetaceae bacterium]
MKKKSLLLLLLLTPIFIFSQQTASDYFKSISNTYAEIESYTANFKITSGVRGNIIEEGVMSYMSPNLLRLDYTKPEKQVINVNSRKLSIYIPRHATLFEQTINSEEEALALETTGLTAQGLALFNTNYSISYVNSPDLEVLDEENPEDVYKLRLIPRKYSEPFSNIIMSITTEGYIRRLESTTQTEEIIIFDIVDIDVDANISPTHFDYEAPPTATTLPDFLFTKEEE